MHPSLAQDPEDFEARPYFKRFKTRGFQLAVAFVFLAAVATWSLFFPVPQVPPFNVFPSWDLFFLLGYGTVLLLWTVRNIRKRVGALFFFQQPDLYCLLLMSVAVAVPYMATVILLTRLLFYLVVSAFQLWMGGVALGFVRRHPSLVLVLSFSVMILLGTSFLLLPQATVDGNGTPFLVALFTMTSAICVTGLTVVDTGSYFSMFGQTIILFGFQMGALAIMFLSSLIALFVGGLLRSARRGRLGRLLDVSDSDSLRRFAAGVCIFTFGIELAGACVLFGLWQTEIPEFGDRIWWSLFHSVSAFCNAGFALPSDSLAGWVDAPSILFCMSALITIGGLGFAIVADLLDQGASWWKSPVSWWKHLHIQTRIVLLATVLLNGLGMIFLLYFEFDGVFSSLSVPQKVWAAWLHAVTLRTAGLSVVPVENLSSSSIVFSCIAMFVGAAPGSTAGGIKITTAFVVLLSLRAMVRGREDVHIMGASIPRLIVYRSMCITFFGAGFLFLALLVLMHSQNIAFQRLLFEGFSAFGTVGLSMGVTPQLDGVGRCLIIFLMFVGRIGPLTLALAIGEKRSQAAYKYPTGDVAVG